MLAHLLSTPPGGRRSALLCFLHGYGEAAPLPSSERALSFPWPPARRAAAPLARREFIVVAPQLPAGRATLGPPCGAQCGTLINEVRATHCVDPRRMYLTGFSFGGNGVFDLGERATGSLGGAVGGGSDARAAAGAANSFGSRPASWRARSAVRSSRRSASPRRASACGLTTAKIMSAPRALPMATSASTAGCSPSPGRSFREASVTSRPNASHGDAGMLHDRYPVAHAARADALADEPARPAVCARWRATCSR